MSATNIDWAEQVWNPVTGCSKVSQGCKNCYAEKMHKRLTSMGVKEYAQPFNKVVCHEHKLDIPCRRKKPTIYFVNSMSDLFHPDVPFDFIDAVYRIMSLARHHYYLILTKRIERALDYYDSRKEAFKGVYAYWNRHNVGLGVSVEDQQTADERIPVLLQIPASMHFISSEPLLGFINLGRVNDIIAQDENIIKTVGRLDWVICGGESGSNARPMHPDWVRLLKEQCKVMAMPFFFKQWGEWLPGKFSNLIVNNGNAKVARVDGWLTAKVGKKKSGHLLDGVEYREVPGQLKINNE